VRVLPRFGQGVAGFEPFGFPAQVRRHARTEVIREDKKIFVRKPCSSVRHDSPGSADRSELMLCVATIGMQRA
jgi:hypothetical protein